MSSLLGIVDCVDRVPVGTKVAAEDKVEQGVQPLHHCLDILVLDLPLDLVLVLARTH